MPKRLILTGIFRNDDAAKAAINSLEKKGKSRNDIAALFADRSDGLAFRIREKTKASEGAAAGGLLGILVGGTIAALINYNTVPAAADTLAFIDPLIAIFSGVGMGSFIGGVIGAVIGRGIPEHEAHVIRGNLKSGNILLAVTADPEDREELLHVLRSTGGKHLTAADQKIESDVSSGHSREDEQHPELTT